VIKATDIDRYYGLLTDGQR